VPERACKAGALPAELHAPCNHMILIVSLIEFREIDYLLSQQVLSSAGSYRNSAMSPTLLQDGVRITLTIYLVERWTSYSKEPLRSCFKHISKHSAQQRNAFLGTATHSSIKSPGLRAVATELHVAPPPGVVPAAIQE
jgi:hypothetical protein